MRTALRHPLALAAAALAVTACSAEPEGGEPGAARAAAGAEAEATPPWFEEVALERGLDFVHASGHVERHWMPEIIGGGAALFDVDGDGDLDAYLVQSGGVRTPRAERPGNRLYANDGRGYFRDVTTGSGADDRGYGMGAACGDADGDGDVDLYVTNLRADALLSNAGAGRFAPVPPPEPAGAWNEGWGTSAAFFDAELDGDLDLFVVNYLEWWPSAELDCRNELGLEDYCSPKNYDAPATDVLYVNRGGGRFEDATGPSGVARVEGTGLGVACADFDADGRIDVFVANDGMPDRLWQNRASAGGEPAFEEVALLAGCALDQEGIQKAGMGVTVGDVDDDGDPDLLVCNLGRESDSYFSNEGSWFRDRTAQAGLRTVSRPFTRFGLGWVDFDDDGTLDLFQANGRVERQSLRFALDPFAEPNLVFRGTGGGRFEEVRPRGGTREPLAATSRAAAFGDVDGDGGVDVLVVNRDERVHLLRNVVPDRGHWLRLRLVDGRGAPVLNATATLALGERTLLREARAAYSYLASNDPAVHVGLGPTGRVERVEVRWPDGTREVFGPLDADREHVLARGAGRPAAGD